jgi:hypothetical protein
MCRGVAYPAFATAILLLPCNNFAAEILNPPSGLFFRAADGPRFSKSNFAVAPILKFHERGILDLLG